MKVLIADRLPEASVAELRDAGFDVTSDPALAGDALAASLGRLKPEVLIVRSTRVEVAALEAAPELGLIVRAGAGTNTIDVAAAADRGVYVANCPGKNSTAVAELALGLILSADRQIPNNVRDVRAGVWAKKKYGAARGLCGRTLGVVGFGAIGSEVAKRARAFGMQVIAWSEVYLDDGSSTGIRRVDELIDIAREADVVSVHLPLTPETRGLIDRTFVETMKPGAILVNTARGGIVDEEALAWGLENRGLRAGLDVYDDEPRAGDSTFDTPLARHDLFFGTHHIGASTDQAQEAVAAEAARIVTAYRDRGEVPNCVNLCEHSPATTMLVVRHRDEVGVLAGVFDALREARINVQETENIIFEGARAAVARILVDAEPPADVLAELTASPSILALSTVAVGDAPGASR